MLEKTQFIIQLLPKTALKSKKLFIKKMKMTFQISIVIFYIWVYYISSKDLDLMTDFSIHCLGSKGYCCFLPVYENVKADLLAFVELYDFVKTYSCFTPTNQLRLRFKDLSGMSFVPVTVLGAYAFTPAWVKQTSTRETCFPGRKLKLSDLSKVTNLTVADRSYLNSNLDFHIPSFFHNYSLCIFQVFPKMMLVMSIPTA